MNRTEASILGTYMSRIDHRTFGAEDARDWADLLDDIALEPALAAAREHYRTDTRWLTPAILRERVEAAVSDSPAAQSVAEAHMVPDTGGDESPQAYIRALRAKQFQTPALPSPRPVGVLPRGGASA